MTETGGEGADWESGRWARALCPWDLALVPAVPRHPLSHSERGHCILTFALVCSGLSARVLLWVNGLGVRWACGIYLEFILHRPLCPAAQAACLMARILAFTELVSVC